MSDILDYIRCRLEARNVAQEAIVPALNEARQIYGGDEVYIRKPPRAAVSRRTIQRRSRATISPKNVARYLIYRGP